MILRFLTFLVIPLLSFCCLLENGRSAVYLSVFEDLQPGKLVGHLPIEGSIDGSNSSIELKVVKGNDIVKLVPGTKDLQLVKELDRDESTGKFEAVIECKSNTDSDFSQLNISVFVTVKDVNDNAPEFDAKEYDITIKEELPVGTIVFTDFEATDKDQPGPNSFVQYSIVQGPFSHLLDIIDPFKPVVTVKNRIDYEKVKLFMVEIEARDQGEPSLSSKVPLRVTVEDVNDLNPFFTYRYYNCKKIKNGVLVLQPEAIVARDGDDLKADIGYELSGESSSHFSIDNKGVIRAKFNPPPNRATFFVTAFELTNREKNATAIVQLNLEKTLRFEYDSYSIKLASSTPQNSLLLTVKATTSKKTPIHYTINNTFAIVRVEEFSGQIHLSGIKEEKGVVKYTIHATDGEEATTALLIVAIDPVDHNSESSRLEFEKPEYHLQLGSLPVLGTIKVRGQSKPTYKLMNLNREFLIDTAGVVRLQPNARPTCSPCELVVMATDDDGASTVAKISIENSAYVMSTTSMLTLLILVVLALIFALLLVLVCRKVHYAWRSHKRTNICWMNNTNDTGITITGTLPTPSRYVVNQDKERAFESAKSPAPKRAQGAHLVPVTVTNQDGAPTVYF